MAESTNIPRVYAAIAAVQADLAKCGVAKTHKNQQQGYSFRGIDDVYNALAPSISAHRLCIMPRMLSRTMTERVTKSGGTLFYVVVEAEFDVISADDGSKHTVRVYGEAMDSADKATNKAMSAAYKYACMQTFCIPTEGDNDADATTHDVAPQKQEPSKPVPAAIPAKVQEYANAIAHFEESGLTCAEVAEHANKAVAEIVTLPQGSPERVQSSKLIMSWAEKHGCPWNRTTSRFEPVTKTAEQPTDYAEMNGAA